MSSNSDSKTLSPLANPRVTREILERFDLNAKKHLGQNFLINDDVVKRIIKLAQVNEDDYIVEVGPGIGTLSIALLKNAGAVVSIERDRRMKPVLADTLAGYTERFTLIEADALEINPNLLPLHKGAQPNKLVANLPYAVAATLVFDYFKNFQSIESATVMMQKEVADRIMAQPGTKNYGAYSVKLSLYAKSREHFNVAPGNFLPAPHVDSTVLRLSRFQVFDGDGHVLRDAELNAICEVVDAAFASRRKTILNSCKSYFAQKGEQGKHKSEMLPELFEHANIDPRRRGETLSQKEFVRLGLSFFAAFS